MKPKFLQLLLPFCAFLLILGCAEDVDMFIPNPEPTYKGDIDHFFDAARDNISQTSIINIDFPTAVVTPRKTVLIFQPKSLVDAAGNVSTGLVEITILELLTKGEILLYGIPTNNREKLLSTGGEFYITASQNGTPLKLVEGKPVRILTDVPAGTTPNPRMELFYGVQDYDATIEDSLYTWDEADDNPNTWDNVDATEWVALADSQQIISGFGYECFSDSLKWINFDVFANIPANEKTDVCVSLPKEYGNVNTVVFLVFNDMESVIALPGNPGTMQFCNYYTQVLQLGVPVGESVTFVVISELEEDNYFFAFVETTLVDDHLEVIIPQETSLEVIKDLIMSL